MPKTCILIRSYDGDLPWLKICLRSISKFCDGFLGPVVVTDGVTGKAVAKYCAEIGVSHVEDRESSGIKEGYVAQQYTKLRSDLFVPAGTEFVCHIDSDSFVTNHHTPDRLLSGGKPSIVYDDYANVGAAIAWKGATEKAIGAPVGYEFMRRVPFVYPTWIYKEVRNHIESRCRTTLIDFCRSNKISEYNLIGAYAFLFKRDAFDFRKVSEPHPFLPHRHLWSHGDLDRGSKIVESIIKNDGMESSLRIAMSVCNKDVFALKLWANWVLALGGLENTRLHLSVSDKIMSRQSASEAVETLRRAFGRVFVYSFPDAGHGYPQAANEMFDFTMKQAALDCGPIAWMEPDCIPVKRGWLKDIQDEYDARGERFCGPIMNDHMNGTGIYPVEWEFLAPLRGCPAGVPFDVFMGPCVKPRSHDSPLWQHDGRRPTISSLGDYERARREGISIYHPSKDGAVIHAINEAEHLISESIFDVEPIYVIIKNPKSTSRTIPGSAAWIRLGTSTWWCATKLSTLKEQANMLALRLPWSEISKRDYESYLGRKQQ